jgi:hypothetical protein
MRWVGDISGEERAWGIAIGDDTIDDWALVWSPISSSSSFGSIVRHMLGSSVAVPALSSLVRSQMSLVPAPLPASLSSPQVKLTLLDQSTYTAKVLGADPDKDVAVLKVSCCGCC